MVVEVLILFTVGAIGGFLAGLLGVGGGILFIPILSFYIEKLKQSGSTTVKAVLANSLFLVFFSGIAAILRQKKLGEYDWKKSIQIGIIGGIVSAAVSFSILRGNWYEPTYFKLFFCFLLVVSLIRSFIVIQYSTQKQVKEPNTLKTVLVAILTGLTVALSGLGGGIIMVPAFQWVFGYDIKKASKLSITIIPFLALVPILQSFFNPFNISNLHTGYIIWDMVLPMLVGVLIFTPIGFMYARKAESTKLHIIFASLTAIILIKTLYEIYI